MYFREKYVMSIAVLALMVSVSHATNHVKFPKDQRMDTIFPPNIELPSSPGLPIGHLRPLGRQQRSSGQVKTGSNETWTTKEAQVFKGHIDNLTIFDVWPRDVKSDETDVVITKRPTNGDTKYESMKLSSFFENYGSVEWLLDQVVSQQILIGMKVPRAFSCLSKKLLYISSSLTSGTTSDDMKISSHHKLQCVLKGRRDYIVMKKSQTTPTLLSKHPQNICEIEAIVNLNPDIVNVFDNPWVISMKWQHATLLAGDCILIPADTIVQTTSYGPECETVTFNWQPSTTCSAEDHKDIGDDLLPLLCSNQLTQKLELCDCKESEYGQRWRKLLESFVDEKTGFLTKSCFANLFKNQVDGEEIFEVFQTVPVTLDVIAELSDSMLSKMFNSAYPDRSLHVDSHLHDEL